MFIRIHHIAPALALCALAACGSDSSTAPAAPPLTLDQALAELSTPALSAPGATFGSVTPSIPALVPSSCAYQASSQSFACTPALVSGLTFTQSYTLLAANGAKQTAFDQKTTNAVRANTAVVGTLQNGTLKLAVAGQQELTLSGLLGATQTLDGSSTVHIDAVAGDDRPFTNTVTATISGLTLRAPTADGTHPWPTSGTITVETSTDVGTGTPVVLRATIVFDGTSTVTATITGQGLSATCKIDLASQAPTCR